MRHAHWRNPRERQNDVYDLNHARAAVLSNYRRGLIALHVAVRQLRDAGMFEAEISEALA